MLEPADPLSRPEALAIRSASASALRSALRNAIYRPECLLLLLRTSEEG